MRILQISDIHWKDKIAITDTYNDMRDAFLEDLKDYYDANLTPFNHIFICGDIAFSGHKAEYDKAKDFINKICEITNCKESEVYIVPGNHDKNIKAESQALREIVHIGLENNSFNEEAVGSIVQYDRPFLKKLYSPFKEFVTFAQQYNCAEKCMHRVLNDSGSEYEETEDCLYWSEELESNYKGYQIMLYGVNTALCSDLKEYNEGRAGHKGHKLFLPKLAYKAAKKTKNVINILMAHHPPMFLTNKDDVINDLDSRFRIQMYGHLHSPSYKTENHAIHLFSGAFQPDEKEKGSDYVPIFNIIDIDIENIAPNNNKLKVAVQVHKWNGTNFSEFKEHSINLEVALPQLNNRWEVKQDMQNNELPENITKRDIRIQLIKHANPKSIIELFNDCYKYDNDKSEYTNIIEFLECVREKKLWVELYNKLNK